ncbi:hypothetical protein EHS25_004783 [Saitozyma podzolica]|uniref:Uncharacterized protein n=1 Tax=Saitozyma podzolica TaxID=1890683 RepID=A0A427Y2S9_9TREE|nr:hypothetical protein EHS25_004783 [Saitozyma podzolica]
MSQVKLTGYFSSQPAIPASPRPVLSDIGRLERNTITYTRDKTTSTLDTAALDVLREKDNNKQYTQKVSPLSCRRRAAIPGEADDIRFTSPELARQTMTPLRHRLLHLSQQKLERLEPPRRQPRGRHISLEDCPGPRGRPVHVEVGRPGPGGGHHRLVQKGARTLWVIGKEEDEDEERQVVVQDKEGRGRAWFEELLANMEQDEYSCDDGRKAEWTESSVSRAVYDDLEYQAEGMVACAIPLPRRVPSHRPSWPHPRRSHHRLDPVFGNPHQITLVELPANVSADANSTEA